MTAHVASLFSVENKRVVVTGALGGIGSAIARLFLEAGATLILADREHSYTDTPPGTVFIPADFSAEGGADALIKHIQNAPVDIVIHTAGIEGHVGSMDDCAEADWLRTMRVNLLSAQLLSAAAVKGMQQRGGGRLIYIGSIAGKRGTSALGLYSVTKAGLSQLARNYAVQQGKYGITANCICPGLTDTPLSKHLQADAAFMTKRMQQTPLNRLGTTDEVAATALYLASAAGGFTTGQDIVVDGGTLISDC